MHADCPPTGGWISYGDKATGCGNSFRLAQMDRVHNYWNARDLTASMPDVGDGAWHHVGITFAVSGGNTVATLYKDAELVESWTADGTILTRPADMNFMIGAGEDATAGFVGLVDELRVTPGQVDPSDFLTPVRNGFCIIFK